MLAPSRPWSPQGTAPPGPLRLIVGGATHALVGVGLISALVNVLYLTGSFFMLEVYDRVIPSRSIPTLVGLGALALVLYGFQGVLEALRSRLLVRVGVALDERLSGRIFALSLRAPLTGATAAESGLMLRDLDQVRLFLSGTGPAALFDLPWLPLYVAICFLFHPLIGVAAIAGAVVLVALTLATELATRGPTKAATARGVQRHALSEASRRNAEAVAAMGLEDALCRRFDAVNRGYIEAQQRTADVGGGLGAISKVWRMALQSAVLALGASLVIGNEATSGIIIASSILVSRALAPAEMAIANWKGFVAARESWGRLSALVARMPETPHRLALPAPSRTLTVEGISLAPPGHGRLIVQDVTFGLMAGQALGVVGASASGKSSLVRALVGVWRPMRGVVRLDGAALDQWPAVGLGRHLGYLPQDAELFAGTVGENIARFDPQATSQAVIAAARAAGVHELILRLPEGYETILGEAGAGLSAGQRQRIGLARALYSDPFLVVLDEPNANLDPDGEHALTQAILGIRARGGICVVVAHRPSALSAVDLLLTMADGRAQSFGPKDAVLKNRLRPISGDAGVAASAAPNPPVPQVRAAALQESA